jgi:hypothetical protein
MKYRRNGKTKVNYLATWDKLLNLFSTVAATAALNFQMYKG